MSDDESAIRTLVQRWLDATRAGDVDSVLQLMAPDVIFLVPGQAPLEGRAAFERGLRAVLDEHVIDSSSIIEEVVVSGDLAYCRTRLSVTVTSRHGQLPLGRDGHTLSILRKNAAGAWQLTRDANLLAPRQ